MESYFFIPLISVYIYRIYVCNVTEFNRYFLSLKKIAFFYFFLFFRNSEYFSLCPSSPKL